jgi:hypothetical protein
MYNDWENYWNNPKETDVTKRICIYEFNPQWHECVDDVKIDNLSNISYCNDINTRSSHLCEDRVLTYNVGVPELSTTLPNTTKAFFYVLDKYYNDYKSLIM